MNNMLSGKDIMKVNDKVLDLKYERKLLRYKKRIKIRKALKQIPRILLVIFMKIGITVGTVAGIIALLATSHFLSAFLLVLVGGCYLPLHYMIVLDFISEKIDHTSNYFNHLNLNDLTDEIKAANSVQKEISSNKKRVNALENTVSLIDITKEDEEYLKEQAKAELMEYVNRNCNLNSEIGDYEIISPNYIPSNKNKLNNLRYIRKALLKYKNIDLDKKYEIEKSKIKELE